MGDAISEAGFYLFTSLIVIDVLMQKSAT